MLSKLRRALLWLLLPALVAGGMVLTAGLAPGLNNDDNPCGSAAVVEYAAPASAVRAHARQPSPRKFFNPAFFYALNHPKSGLLWVFRNETGRDLLTFIQAFRS